MRLLVVDCNNVSQSDEEKEERKELQILAKYRQRTYADSCAFTEGLLFILRMNSRVYDQEESTVPVQGLNNLGVNFQYFKYTLGVMIWS